MECPACLEIPVASVVVPVLVIDVEQPVQVVVLERPLGAESLRVAGSVELGGQHVPFGGRRPSEMERAWLHGDWLQDLDTNVAKSKQEEETTSLR